MYYDKQTLFAWVQAAQLEATPSLFKDWIDKGIVGKAVKREYPGSGSKAFWSDKQLNHFLVALRQRQHFHATIAHLCNLPVWNWLYFGEQMTDVPLTQVQTAMNTWLEDMCYPSIRSARKSIQELVDAMESPHATDRLAFIKALETHERLPEDELEDYLQNIIDPKHRGEARGPRGGALTVFTVKAMITMRTQAMEHLEEIPEYLWEWARAFLQFVMRQYSIDQPELATDPDLGHLFKQETPGSLCSSACLDLLSVLGIGMKRDTLRGFPPQLHPKEWRTKRLKSIIESNVVPIGLVQPNGMPFLKMHTKVTIVSQQE